jgi:hypothetical protein
MRQGLKPNPHFGDVYGPAEAVPLLRIRLRLSFSATCEAALIWGSDGTRKLVPFQNSGSTEMAGGLRAPAIWVEVELRSDRRFATFKPGDFYWQPVKARLGVMATVVNGPVPVRARGGLEFTSEAVQVLVVIPSTA